MFASNNALNEYFGSYMNIRVLLLQKNKIFLHIFLHLCTYNRKSKNFYVFMFIGQPIKLF